MMGFTLPLLGIGLLEGVVAANLMCPLPLCRPGILVCRLSNSQIGRTICYTVTVVLALLLIAPVYDLLNLHRYRVSRSPRVTVTLSAKYALLCMA